MFYTKPCVAQRCYNRLLKKLPRFRSEEFLWIEPSAGSGSFFDLIESSKKIAFDIAPQKKYILTQDFLNEFEPFYLGKFNKDVIFIGNPPFGNRAKKAIQFFNRASEFADTIAFILPNQFKKYSAQSQLPKDFKLIDELSLEDNSFLFLDKEYKVRCVFQIWTRLDVPFEDKRIRVKPAIEHPDFKIYQYNNTPEAKKYFEYEWDFAVPRQGFYDYSLKIRDKSKLNEKIQWIFLKAKNKEIQKRLERIDFEKLAKNNTTIMGFGKHDLVKEYIQQYG